MSRNPRAVSAGNSMIAILVLLTALVFENALISDERWYWCLLITIPAIVLIVVFAGNKSMNIK